MQITNRYHHIDKQRNKTTTYVLECFLYRKYMWDAGNERKYDGVGKQCDTIGRKMSEMTMFVTEEKTFRTK